MICTRRSHKIKDVRTLFKMYNKLTVDSYEASVITYATRKIQWCDRGHISVYDIQTKNVCWVHVMSKTFSYTEVLQEMVRLSGPLFM